MERVITVKETVESQLDPQRAFAYLSQFEHTAEWDPGTIVSKKVSNEPVSVGAKYDLEAEFRGKRSPITYTVTELSDRRIQLRGENDRVISVDTISVAPGQGGGSSVTYLAEFSVKGVFKIAEPFLKSSFQKLGKPAAAGMKNKLDDLIRSSPTIG